MKNYQVVTLIAVLLFSACAGKQVEKREIDPLQEKIRQRALAFEQAREAVAMGSPAAIDRGLKLLEETGVRETERGSELAYAALAIRRIVFPYLEDIEYPVSLPSASVYTRIVKMLEEGFYPELNNENTTFITLLMASLTLITGEAEQKNRAEETAVQLVEVNPASLLARYLRALVYRRNGDIFAALDSFMEIAEEDSSFYPALLGIVEICEKRGRPVSALPSLEELLERFPRKSEVLFYGSRLLISVAEYQRADALLSGAISLFPEDEEFLLIRLVLLERLGNLDKAERLLRAIESGPGERFETLLVRGRIALREGRYQEAELSARRAMEDYGDRYEAALLLSQLLFFRERGEEAYTLLKTAWEENPWNMEILRALLDVGLAQEQWQESEGYLRQLLDYAPQSFEILRQAVRFFRDSGKIEKAVSHAEEMVSLYTDRIPAVTVYLELLISSGRSEEARRYIEGRLAVSTSAEMRSLLYYFRSEVEEGVDRQIESLQSALFENMQNIRALIKIADLYEGKEELDKAARYLRQAVAARPNNEELRFRLRRLEMRTE